MSESIHISLSKDNDMDITESVSLDNERVICIHRGGNNFVEDVLTPTEAVHLGLALISMASVAKVKDARPDVFGESTTSKVQTREVGKKDRRQSAMRENFGTPGRRTSDARKKS